MTQIAEQMRIYLRGWKSYFQLAQTPKIFKALDSWIRHRLRALSSLSTDTRERLSIIASAGSGLPMSRLHLWQEARGTGGDTAKLG